MQQDDPGSLRRLADIVVPEPVPFWPPAPGWYVVIAAVVVTCSWLAWRRWRAWDAAAYRRAAAAELARLDQQREWRRLSELLKRTALAAFPRAEVAPLYGEEWLSFLDRTGGTQDFTGGAGRHLMTLAHDPRAEERVPEVEARRVVEVCAVWIRTHRAERRRAS